MSEPEAGPRMDLLARTHTLLLRYTVALTRLASAHLGPESVGNRDVETLLTLAEQPGPTPSSLADSLGLSRSSMSHVLQRLQRDGLVERVTDERDRRSARLQLTRRGAEGVRDFADAVARYLATTATEAHELAARLAPDAQAGQPVGAPHLTLLLSRVGGAYVTQVTSLLAPYSATEATDRFTLTLLRHLGTARPSELAQELDITYGGLSVALDRLEGAGLIDRVNRPDLGDRRTVLVSLTPRGTEAAELALTVLDHCSEELAAALFLVDAPEPT